MTLNASGAISLGGATVGQSINLENQLSATALVSLNDAAVRALAGVPSGAIAIPTNFYGKSFSAPFNGFSTPIDLGSGIGQVQFAAISPAGRLVIIGTNASNSKYSTTTSILVPGTPGAIRNREGNSLAVSTSGLFVFMGLDFDTGNFGTRVNTSSDGSTWTNTYIVTPDGANFSFTKYVCYSPFHNKFCAVGETYTAAGSFSPYKTVVSTSTDGVTWTTPAYFGSSIPEAMSISGIVVNSAGIFVAYGRDNNSGYNWYSRSTDGITWTTFAKFNGANRTGTPTMAVSPSSLFMAIFNTGGTAYVSTSSDGSTWTTPTSRFTPQSSTINTFAVNNGNVFVYLMLRGGNSTWYWRSSTDGISWTAEGSLVRTGGFNYGALTSTSTGQFLAYNGQYQAASN